MFWPLCFLVMTAQCGAPPKGSHAPEIAPEIALDAPDALDTAAATPHPDTGGTGDASTQSAATGSAPLDTDTDTDTDTNVNANADTASTDTPPLEEIRFAWSPSARAAGAYEMSDPQDQHRIIFTRGVAPNGTYPVVLAFHGQPSPTASPRDYRFVSEVPAIVHALVDSGEVPPLVLVIPVFRFVQGNWPLFSPIAFQKQVVAQLAARDIVPGDWLAFGHSGAAGCGGDGLNSIHTIAPQAVGFFDTCLGPGWQTANRILRDKKIPTVNIFSVETAGFRPRQRPEYQSTFDFGRAFAPIGLAPITCPEVTPGPLRDQPYACAADETGHTTAFVADTGEGQAAHQQILAPAIRYFLQYFAQQSSVQRANP